MHFDHLIIFAGQSNMQGQCEAPAITTRVENAYEYRLLTDEIRPLTAPVGENIAVGGDELQIPNWQDVPAILNGSTLLAPVDGNANMVPAFMQAFIRKTGKPALAVHTAKGSTQIDYWLKGNTGFSALMKKAKAAIDKAHPKHVYLVWLQGESDAIAGVKEQEYYEKLILLKNQLKEDLGLEKFGVIRVGVFTMNSADEEIMRAQSHACQTDSDLIMLTEIAKELFNSPRYMNPFAHGHYSAEGMEILGTLSGSTFGAYAAESEK
ncbi:MAG: sialate O-acetylesterase [Clostridiales bacterium]|nr:sialate O-acetylesterase [Clostridiales bacterium]